jgi:hypothetical protein
MVISNQITDLQGIISVTKTKYLTQIIFCDSFVRKEATSVRIINFRVKENFCKTK